MSCRFTSAVLLSVVLLVASGCAGDSTDETGLYQDQVSQSTTPSTTTTTGPLSSTSSSTTSTGMASPTPTTTISVSPLGVAEYLAASAEIAAVALIDIGQAASNPYTMVTVYEDWATLLAALSPPSDLQDYHVQWVRAVELQRDAGLELVGSEDPQAALAGYMESMTEAAVMMEDLAPTEAELILEVFNQREGDPEAEYFVARAHLNDQGEGGSFVEELFAALGGIADDPERSLKTIADLVDAADPLMEGWNDLEPPPALEGLHNRQSEHWDEFVQVFASIVDAFEADEPPPQTLISQLQALSQEAPLLNAEWTLVTAAALRGDNSSGLEGRWHRYGGYDGDRHHMQLFCTGSTAVVECRFVSQGLTNMASTVAGQFVGSPVDASFCIPSMRSVCDRATFITQGTMNLLASNGQEVVAQDTIAVLPDGTLMVTWDSSSSTSIPRYCVWERADSIASQADSSCTTDAPI